jgi:polyisoprenyl-teichoic acid--peptidoglycan teichoic acid transferase
VADNRQLTRSPARGVARVVAPRSPVDEPSHPAAFAIRAAAPISPPVAAAPISPVAPPAEPSVAPPPVAPPATARPATNPGTPKRRSPLWAKALVLVGSLIVVISVTAAIGVRVVIRQVANAIPTQQLLGEGGTGTGAPVFSGSDIKGAINLLLIGLDTRANNPTMGSRSDSIIIAHIPASHDKVYLVSIPRDTWTPIPGHGTTKINAAFQFGSTNGGGYAGGTSLLARTIKQNWGITFQGAAIIQFDGFKDIVTKLGGVSMYVDETTPSIHHGIDVATGKPAMPYRLTTNGIPICPRGVSFSRDPNACAIPGRRGVIYQKGYQHLTAYEALDFVRSRDGLPYTDYDRQRHQQQFIKALLEEAYHKGLSDPTKLSSFLTSIAHAFVFDPGKASIQDWIFTLKGINPSSIVTIKTNAGKYYSAHVRGVSAEAISPESAQLLRDLRDGTVDEFLAEHPDWQSSS